MPYAVDLFFDEPSEKPIREIWAKLARLNISSEIPNSGIRPHITMAVFDNLKCQPCEKKLSQYAAHTAGISLCMTHLGVFYRPEIVVFLAPTPTRELLEFQAGVHQCLAKHADKPWDIYLPGNWVPHCTLAINLDKNLLPTVISQCTDIQFPFNVQVAQIGVSEFLPIRDLYKLDLKLAK